MGQDVYGAALVGAASEGGVMTIAELVEWPTILENGPGGQRFHESVLRSYQVLQKARQWLLQGTPPGVVLEMIDHCMDAPGRERSFAE